MRFGFVTCVELGFAVMEKIYRIGGRLEVAVTLPEDKAVDKSGRVLLDDFAAEHEIPLVKVANINADEALDALAGYDLDWLFIIGWSQIAGKEVLSLPRHGVLGMHPTLLPEGRGRASIPWAILKALPETGVTLFQLDEGVDSGPILAQQRISLDERETATMLYDKVKQAHRTLIAQVWDDLNLGRIEPQPQDHDQATYWEGRTPEDGRITHSMTIDEVDTLVRAVTRPYPGAFLEYPDGRVLRIWEGHPAQPPVGTADNAQPVIDLADGRYQVVEFDWERS